MGSNPTFPTSIRSRVTAQLVPATFGSGALRGEARVVGDKSISHRALMLALLAPGASRIERPNRGEDVVATRDAIVQLGATVSRDGDAFVVEGGTLRTPERTIDARNSGTTARLLMGLCAGNGLNARFDGDESLRRRPMERVARPLRAMGATVETHSGRLPAAVRGLSAPPGGDFALEIASAQVKSAILLANVNAGSRVRVTGDRFSRDHTERMLRHFGRTISFDGRSYRTRARPSDAASRARSGRSFGRGFLCHRGGDNARQRRRSCAMSASTRRAPAFSTRSLRWAPTSPFRTNATSTASRWPTCTCATAR